MARSENSEEIKRRGEQFREMVKSQRKHLQLTQTDLALKANISVDMVRALEGGRSCNPSFFVAVDIMTALGVELGRELGKWSGQKK